MKRKVSITTRSEAFQKISQKKNCPNLLACESSVTKEYFIRICHSQGFVRCHHYARAVGELMVPLTWLQRQAIEEEVIDVENESPVNNNMIK
jgi:hypothetical protein